MKDPQLLGCLRESLKKTFRTNFQKSAYISWMDKKSQWRRVHCVKMQAEIYMRELSGGCWPIYAHYRECAILNDPQLFLWGDMKVEELSRKVGRKAKRTYSISFTAWVPPYNINTITKIQFVFDPQLDIIQLGEQISFSFMDGK